MIQSVGQSKNFPASSADYRQHGLHTDQPVLSALSLFEVPLARINSPRRNLPYFDIERRPIRQLFSQIDSTGCTTFNATTCGTNSRFYRALAQREPQLLGRPARAMPRRCWQQIQAFAQMPRHRPPASILRLVVSKALEPHTGHGREWRRAAMTRIRHRQIRIPNRYRSHRCLRHQRRRSVGRPHDLRQRHLGRRLGYQRRVPAAKRRLQPRPRAQELIHDLIRSHR